MYPDKGEVSTAATASPDPAGGSGVSARRVTHQWVARAAPDRGVIRPAGGPQDLEVTDAPARPGASVAGESDPLVGARMMVIDDSRVDALVVDGMLRRAGASSISIVHDPTEAVELMLRDLPDGVVLDLHMPVLDGYGVLAELRQGLGPDRFVPVLVLTGDTTRSARERALDAGANDFLTKPCHEIEFVQRVRNLLSIGRRYHTVRHRNVVLQAELDASTAAVRRVVDEVARRRETMLDTIARRSFRSVYQPIVDLRDRTVVGVEALARFGGPPHRPTAEWFDDADELGLSVELERAAIEVALGGLPDLPAGMFLSLNASPSSVVTGEILDAIRDVPGERLVIELTEHNRVDDHERVRSAVDELRSRGVRIAIDDVGAGYAGLQWILRLRPDMIKLDLELPRGIDGDPVRRALTTALLEFGVQSGARVIAEGIETAGELTTLAQLGVTWGQGFYLARPGPLALQR